MESIGFMSVGILVAVATFVLTAVVSVWRINASHTKRLDQFSISFNARMDALDNKMIPRWMHFVAKFAATQANSAVCNIY